MFQTKFGSEFGALLLCGVCAACATAMSAGVSPVSPPKAAEVSQPSAASDGEPEQVPLMAAQSLPLSALEQVVQSPVESGGEGDPERYRDEVSAQGQRARGLYFSAPMARRLGTAGIIRNLRGSRLDAAVIDVKDDAGRITFATELPEFQSSRHVFLRDAPSFLRELKAAGIYTIARVVCFNDPVLPKLYPDRAVIDTRPRHLGKVWNLHKGRNTWLDPSNERNHELLIALAREVQALGFDEIQLDYIRFPVDEGTKFARFPGEAGKPRREILLGFLRRMDEALRIPLGVDVFGLTAFRQGDPAGLGQSLEDWSAHVEVFSPMLYVNGMKPWMHDKQQERAGLLVAAGVRHLRERVGPEPVIRPFLQAFENGADYYNGEFVAEQIRGARSGGGDGFLFWHPASTYAMVRQGMAGATGEIPFRIDERASVRQQHAAQKRSTLVSSAVQAEAPAAVSGDGAGRSPQGS